MGYNESPNIVNIIQVSSILINLDIISGSYVNGSASPTIYSFYPNVSPGYKIVERPSPSLVFYPVSRNEINSMRVWLTDQDNESIDLRGEQKTVRICIREVKNVERDIVQMSVLSKLSNRIAFYNKQNTREFKKYIIYIIFVNKTKYGYSSRKKYITGKGFVESLSSVFHSLKSSASPVFKSIGNYVVENKDLLAKPLLGAVSSLAATELTAGVPAILTHIANRNRKKNIANPLMQTMQPEVINENLEPKCKEILQNIFNSKRNDSSSNPLTNIIGSGIKSF